MVQGQCWHKGHTKEKGKELGVLPSAPDSWWVLHYLQPVGQQLGEASHFWELCRREGQLLECTAISSIWVGSLPPMRPHPPVQGTPRHHRDEISFPGLIQLHVNALSEENAINNERSLLSQTALLRKLQPNCWAQEAFLK